VSLFTDLLASDKPDIRFLVILEPYDAAITATRTLYYSSHGFVSGASDSPAHTLFAERLSSAISIKRALFKEGRLAGSTLPGGGRLRLSNADGGLDALAGYAWSGRRVRVYMGGPGFAFSDFVLIFDGTTAGFEHDDDYFTIVLRDLQEKFDRLISTARYAGTGGAEGTANMKDRLKPIALGLCRNITPVYLGKNTGGRHIFDVGSGLAGTTGTTNVDAVYVSAVALSAVDGTPAAGQFRHDVANGTIELGGSITGPITCNVIGLGLESTAFSQAFNVPAVGASIALTVGSGKDFPVNSWVIVRSATNWNGYWFSGTVTSYVGSTLTMSVVGANGVGVAGASWVITAYGTVAQVQKWIANTLGVTSYDATAYAALNAVLADNVGIWLPEGGTGLDVMDRIANGSGTWYTVNRAGQLAVGRITAPASPVAFYDTRHILSIKREQTADPTHLVNLRYQRNWTPLTADQIAGGVSAADRTYFQTEWRQVVAQDSSVLTAYPLATPIDLDGVIDHLAYVTTEATRLLDLYKVKRDFFRVRLNVQTMGLEIGQVINITHPRYGLASGKNFVVVDMEEIHELGETELGIWG
jgi:hypothetical protein